MERVEEILAARPEQSWWAALTNYISREKLGGPLSQGQPAMLAQFYQRVLDAQVPDPAHFLMTPWEFWFTRDLSTRPQIPEDRFRELVETGAAAFDEPPADFATLSAALSLPGKVAVTWELLKVWLYHLTTREFLLDFLARRQFKLTADGRRLEDDPKRWLWLRFQMVVTRRVRDRSDLLFLGLTNEIGTDTRQRSNNEQFRELMRVREQQVLLLPYVHGRPDQVTELDRDLETGYIGVLKKAGAEFAHRVAELERFLDHRFLVSWVAQRTQQREDDLYKMTREYLYAYYLWLTSCNDAPDLLAADFDVAQLLAWLESHDAVVTDVQKDSSIKLVQRFCQVEAQIAEKAAVGDFSRIDKRPDALGQFARLHYVAADPVHIETQELLELASRLAKIPYAGMSRAAAHAVINRVLEDDLSDGDFLQMAKERELPAVNLSNARIKILESNTKRMRYFANACLPANLATATRDLDLVRSPHLHGRALADSLMRQYLDLLRIYGTCAVAPEDIEIVLREFVLRHQFAL